MEKLNLNEQEKRLNAPIQDSRMRLMPVQNYEHQMIGSVTMLGMKADLLNAKPRDWLLIPQLDNNDNFKGVFAMVHIKHCESIADEIKARLT